MRTSPSTTETRRPKKVGPRTNAREDRLGRVCATCLVAAESARINALRKRMTSDRTKRLEARRRSPDRPGDRAPHEAVLEARAYGGAQPRADRRPLAVRAPRGRGASARGEGPRPRLRDARGPARRGGKRRVVGVDSGTIALIGRWLELRRKLGLPAGGAPLFCSLAGKPSTCRTSGTSCRGWRERRASSAASMPTGCATRSQSTSSARARPSTWCATPSATRASRRLRSTSAASAHTRQSTR